MGFRRELHNGGLLEDTRIGDRLRVGSAEFVVTQPRMPCFKLGIRFNRSDMVKRFLQSGRTGFYLPFSKKGKSQLAIQSSCLKEMSTTFRSPTL